MFNVYWKTIKSISLLRKIIAQTYYFTNGTRYNLLGNNNLIALDLTSKFPFLKNAVFTLKGNTNQIEINSGARISNTQFKIDGNNNKIIVQENCIINGGCFWIKSDRSKIFIGKNTTIVKANIGIAESDLSITIGENCMLAHDIDIRCGDSHSIIDLKSRKRINYASDIDIGHSVWLAAGVKILKSLTIGTGSIIGMGSIVTKNIPENCLAVGIPAQVKKTNVTWLREQISVEHQKADSLEKLYLH